METIKEIATVCGVSEQSIRKWCKRNQVAKQRNQSSKESYVIDEKTKCAILQYYHAEIDGETTKPSCETTKPSCETTKPQDNAVNALIEQLKEKDKQIEGLNQQLSAMTATVTAMQQTQQDLTAALAAAQALHAGTLQRLTDSQIANPITEAENVTDQSTAADIQTDNEQVAAINDDNQTAELRQTIENQAAELEQLRQQLEAERKPKGFLERLLRKKKKENNDEISG